MRFFIALEIPAESEEQIRQIQQRLVGYIPQVKLTDNDKLHLTLAFVGNQDAEFKQGLINALNQCISGIPPFEIIPAYLDAFPDLHYPNIFWLGVKGDIDLLFKLKERIKDELTNLQLPVDERRFVPHIAIAKINNYEVSEELERQLEEIINFKLDPIKVSAIKLFESIPQHGFHQHNTLAEIKLTS
jgi:RNA 2',3'-cyclic 3'-phosphodiesterase